jgi:hypothetical protein
MLPTLQSAKDWDAIGLQNVRSGLKDICNLAFENKDRQLTWPNDQLSAILDLVVITRKPPNKSPPCVINPLDDVDKLASYLGKESHSSQCSGPGSNGQG